MVEETCRGHVGDMEWDMDGGTEKEGINIAPPFLPTKVDSPARFNSKT